MKKTNCLLSVLLCSVLFCLMQTAAAQHSINFDSDWTITLPNGQTKAVTLPHAWNEDDAFRMNNAQLPTDTVRYVKV